MKLSDKIVLGHMGYFNNDCNYKYRENSKEVCSISTKKKNIHIIELDLRKSKDGVLYCYHGSLLQYHFFLKFPMKFSTLRRRYGVDKFEDILDVITKNKVIFLDLKDSNINRKDLIDAFRGRKFKEIILGNKSPSYLRKFDPLPPNFVKIMNGNIFCNFYNLKKLKREGFKYFEVVFPFQINKDIIKKVEDNGMEFRTASLFFFNKESYFNKIKKYNIKHITSDFIA